MKGIIEEMKNLVIQNNIPVFGIAKASSLESGPLGYRPSDILKSAERILCIQIDVHKA